MTAQLKSLHLPAKAEDLLDLRVGDAVRIHGDLLTGRDKAHKWLASQLGSGSQPASADDQDAFEQVRRHLKDGGIYHCGPIVKQLETGQYRMLAAGPTTSIREEPYQAELIENLGLRVIIGKGGMGERTRLACQRYKAVYCHAIGGAAVSTADKIVRVNGVYNLAFGVPEALWWISVRDFPAVVTIDAHGASLHERVFEASAGRLKELLDGQVTGCQDCDH